jgi:hypothetical protein
MLTSGLTYEQAADGEGCDQGLGKWAEEATTTVEAAQRAARAGPWGRKGREGRIARRQKE